MNVFTVLLHRQARRRFLPFLAAMLVLALIRPAGAQPVVPGSYVTSLNWSDDGSLLAIGTGQIIPPWGDSTQGGMARVIERDGRIVFSMNYSSSVGNVEVSPTENLALVGSFREVFDLDTGQSIVAPSDSIAFIHGTWHPTSDLLLLTLVLGARTYDPIDRNTLSGLGRAVLPINSPADGRTVTSAWSPNGLLAATSTTLGSIYIWDTTREVSAVQTSFSEHTSPVQHLVWNAATNLIASGDDSGRILVWNPDTGEIVRELAGHNAAILDLDWRADGMQIVSTSLDNTMRVWDWPSGASQVVTSGQLVSAVAYSPDGSELAYGGEVTDPANIQIDIVPVSELVTTPPRPASDAPAGGSVHRPELHQRRGRPAAPCHLHCRF
jgi:WD40 repeat protein